MNFDVLNERCPNKTAFITGAGSGLGHAFVKLLSQNGWTLHLSDMNSNSLSQSVESLHNQESIHLHELNVANLGAYEEVVQKALKVSPAIDLLINNAGIGDGSLFHDYRPEDWERMIQVNLMGTYYGCHLLVPHMQQIQNGMIINIGSAAGFMNAPGMSAYNVSKAAVYSLSETLLHELKTDHIHVAVLTPTFFKTNVMSQSTGPVIFKNFVDKQMKYSTTNADEVAAVTLTQAAKGTFQIIHPKEARRNHFIKKWFPKLVDKQFEKLLHKFKG